MNSGDSGAEADAEYIANVMAGPGEEREVPEMMHDERPDAGPCDSGAGGADDIWSRADPAQQASAAGPASSVPDLVFGRHGPVTVDAASGSVVRNLAGYGWRSVVDRSQYERLKKASEEFPGNWERDVWRWGYARGVGCVATIRIRHC